MGVEVEDSSSGEGRGVEEEEIDVGRRGEEEHGETRGRMRRKGNDAGGEICQRKQGDDFDRTKRWERRGEQDGGGHPVTGWRWRRRMS